MPTEEYSHLQLSNEPWSCKKCLDEALPFFDTSNSDSIFDIDTSHLGEHSPFEGSGSGLMVSHLNIRSMVPKLEELQMFLEHCKSSHVYTRDIASLNVMRARGTLPYYVRTRLPYCLAYYWGKAPYFRYVSHCTKSYRCAYYDHSTTTVREQTFDGYYT